MTSHLPQKGEVYPPPIAPGDDHYRLCFNNDFIEIKTF